MSDRTVTQKIMGVFKPDNSQNHLKGIYIPGTTSGSRASVVIFHLRVWWCRKANQTADSSAGCSGQREKRAPRHKDWHLPVRFTSYWYLFAAAHVHAKTVQFMCLTKVKDMA